MGLFDKTRTDVGSSSMKVFGDEEPRDFIGEGILHAYLTTGDYMNVLLHYMHESFSLKARAAYIYAKSTYTYGLPEGTQEYWVGDPIVITPIIQAIEDAPIEMLSVVVDKPHANLLAKQTLMEVYDWEYNANIVHNPPFTVPVEATTPVSVQGYKIINSTTVEILFRYYMEYDFGSGPFSFPTDVKSNITVPVFSIDGLYYHASYLVVDPITREPTSPIKYWFYDPSTNVYPSLTLAHTTPLKSPYYPIVPLWKDNKNMAREELHTTDLYKTSKQLLKLLGVNMDEVCEGIANSESVDDITHAFTYFGVDLHSDDPIAKKYLFDYFTREHTRDRVDEATFLQFHNRGESYKRVNLPPVNRIIVQDAGMKFEMGYNYITISDPITGLAAIDAKPGEVHRSSVAINPVEVREKKQTNHRTGELEEGDLIYQYEMSTFTLKKQISTNVYIELTVVGLKHINHINSSYTFDTTVALSQQDGNFNFIIPLNKAIVADMSNKDEVALIYESFQIMFNSVIVTELEWYQQQWFQILVVIVQMYLFVVSMGSLGAPSSWALSGAARLGFTGAMKVFVAVTIQQTVNVLIGKIFVRAVELLGLDEAFEILLTLVVVALSFKSFNFIKGIDGAPFADQLLFAASGIQTGIQTNVAIEMATEAEDWTDFLEESKEKADELKEEMDALWPERNEYLDAWHSSRTAPILDFNESPTDFFNRTIHTGNIGTLAVDAIHQYTALKLQLPEIDYNNLTRL